MVPPCVPAAHRRSVQAADPRGGPSVRDYHGPDGSQHDIRRPPRPDRYPRSGGARPAHLGHRPVQLPLHVLHAQGDLRAGLRVPAARPGPDASRRSSGVARVVRRRSASRSCGSPAASRSSGATCRASSRCSPTIRRPDGGALDLTLTTNGSALRAPGRPARRGRPAARHGQPRFARRRGLRGDERDRLPGRPRARRDRRRHRGRVWRRSRSTWSSGAAINEDERRSRWRAGRARRGVILRFIEYMDVGHSNGWRLDEVVPGGRARRHDRGGLADRAGRAGLPGRGRRALAVPRRRRRVRGHLVGDRSRSAATARARGSRPRASSTPACSRPRVTISARSSARTRATRTCADVIESIWLAPRRSLFRAALGGDLDAAEDRDVRDGWLRRRDGWTPGFSTACPQASTSRGWRRRGRAGLRG